MDKFSGAIVAERGLLRAGVDAGDVASGSTVDELLHSDSGELLEAHLTPDGTVAWRPVTDTAAATRRVLARSQMGSMLRDDVRNAHVSFCGAGAALVRR